MIQHKHTHNTHTQVKSFVINKRSKISPYSHEICILLEANREQLKRGEK